MAKDLFSQQSNLYARYRPTYPPALYEYIFKRLNGREWAWDCATGNGQVASVLADQFKKVYATDLSEKQLAEAIKKPNIIYSRQAAETTDFQDHAFDLVTVGQAYHWFSFPGFQKEVKRVAKPGALIAIWGYKLCTVNDKSATDIILDFYNHVVGAYWEPERKYLEDHYNDMPMPLDTMESADFSIDLQWDAEMMIGYISTWSSVQQFIRANGYNPVPELEQTLYNKWKPGELKQISFPLFLKLGRIS